MWTSCPRLLYSSARPTWNVYLLCNAIHWPDEAIAISTNYNSSLSARNPTRWPHPIDSASSTGFWYGFKSFSRLPSCAMLRNICRSSISLYEGCLVCISWIDLVAKNTMRQPASLSVPVRDAHTMIMIMLHYLEKLKIHFFADIQQIWEKKQTNWIFNRL